MKRIFALVLAVVMIAAMSVPAFAAEVDTGSKDVTAYYVAGQTSGPVYMVDIAWGSMEFTYTAASEGTWDPESHTYDGVTEAGWTCDTVNGANKVTVTNHSNGAVSVAITESNLAEGIEFGWDKDSFTLASADNGQGENGAGKPVSDSALLTVSGNLAKPENSEKVTIGTITVTISEVE